MAYNLRKSDDVNVNGKEGDVSLALAHVLGDTFTLYLKTLNYHWNVQGSRFVAIHELTDKQYHDMFEAIDTIAERIRALGYFSPGSYKEFNELTSISEVDEPGKASAETMLENLVSDHMKVVHKLKESIEIAEGAKDSTTADLLSERRDFHEQAAWMLRSLTK